VDSELAILAFNLLPGLVRESQSHKTMKTIDLLKKFTAKIRDSSLNALSLEIINIAKEWALIVKVRRERNSERRQNPLTQQVIKSRIESLVRAKRLSAALDSLQLLDLIDDVPNASLQVNNSLSFEESKGLLSNLYPPA
jgi:hypothetical protein